MPVASRFLDPSQIAQARERIESGEVSLHALAERSGLPASALLFLARRDEWPLEAGLKVFEALGAQVRIDIVF